MLSIGEAIVAGTPVLTNTVPYSHEWITQNKLGIVKDNWTEEDMHEIVMNNQYYVDNCSRYSSQLLLSELPNQIHKTIQYEMTMRILIVNKSYIFGEVTASTP